MINKENLLTKILKYKMTEEEAKAWKIGILFLILVNKKLPDYEQPRVPQKDPRKTLLFKCCMKALREFKLKDNEWKDFILSQIEVLKSWKDGKAHSLISPECICSTKSLFRYKIYQKKLSAAISHQETIEKMSENEFRLRLNNSKKFLDNKKVNFCDIKNNLNKVYRWVAMNMVSPAVLILSGLDTEDLSKYNVSVEKFKKTLPDNAEDIFKEIFKVG